MANYRYDASDIKKRAAGKWLSIFQYICPGVFDDAIRNLGEHVTCPFHGGENDFRFVQKPRKGTGNTADVGVAMCTCGFYNDGIAVLRRATGLPFGEVLKLVNDYLGGDTVQTYQPPTPVIKQPSPEELAAEEKRILGNVNNLWSAGRKLALDSTPYYVERGLEREALTGLSDVRSIGSLGYYHKVQGKLTKLGSFPAILALMRDVTGKAVAVHRTWLSPDQKTKAPVPKAKKLSETPGVVGAAIRLFDATNADTLGLSEGIETAIGARNLAQRGYWTDVPRNIPVWATFAERNLRSFMIPKELLATLKRIVVFADNDESGTGITAAKAFKDRMALEHPQLEVIIKLPDVVGLDWLDVLINHIS